MPSSSIPLSPTIEVDGTELSTPRLALLTSLRVETAVNLVGRLSLRFADAGYQLSTATVFGIGNKISVRIGNHPDPVFTGEVSGLALDHSAGHVPELVVTAQEPTWKLATETSPRVFENIKPAEVVARMVREVGLVLMNYDATMNDVIAPYNLKLGSSLGYLDEMVRTNGAMWWFEAPNEVHVGKVKPITSVPVSIVSPHTDGNVALGETLLTFSVKSAAGRPDSTTVRSWDPKTKTAIVGTETAPPFSSESAFVDGVRKRGSTAQVTRAGSPATPKEAELLARSIHTSAHSDTVTARGTAMVDPRIRPGLMIEVREVGPSSGRYLVTRVEHVYDRRGFHTNFHTGSHRPRGLADTLGAAGRPTSRVDGVMVGIVTNINDPDKNGRVRVKFPSLGDRIESAWARVATFDAGKDRGATFLPEVEDEVLIAFEDGSLSRPVVIGSLFGGRNTQPELERLLGEGTVNTRRLTSRSGHALEMVDEQNNGSLLLKHGSKPMSIKFDEKSETLSVEAKGGVLKLSNGQASITLAKNGDITIEGTNLTLKATTNLTLDAGANATVKAKSEAKVEGTTVSVKGTASATFQGGTTTIKGATVAIN